MKAVRTYLHPLHVTAELSKDLCGCLLTVDHDGDIPGVVHLHLHRGQSSGRTLCTHSFRNWLMTFELREYIVNTYSQF